MLNLLMVVLNDQTCDVAFPRKDDWELCFICEIPSLDPTTNPQHSIMVKEWNLLLSLLSSSAAQMIYLVLLETALTDPSLLKRRPSGLL